MIRISEELVKTVGAVAPVVSALLHRIGEELLRWRRAEGELAIIEVVAHMADTDERSLARIQRMLSEEEPYLEAFDQEQLARDRGYIEFDLGTELDRLESTLVALEALLLSLDEAGWARTRRHEEHGVMSVSAVYEQCEPEDVDHLAQIARLVER